MISNKVLAKTFALTAATSVTVGTALAAGAGYTLPYALVIGAGTGLSAAFCAAAGMGGGLYAANSIERRKGESGFEGFGRAVFLGVGGGIIGAAAGAMLGYEVINNLLDDAEPIPVKHQAVAARPITDWPAFKLDS